jgi:hypothetical protein
VPAEHELSDLVVLARHLMPVDRAPTPAFRAALREQLVAEAAARATAMPAQRVPEPQETPRRRPRLAQAVASVAIASVVAGAGAAVASSRALPGDALYGLKRQIENVQLALAGSDLDRGRELLEQADSRLGEAERLAASQDRSEPGTRAAVATALTEMRAATEAGASALTESYQETGDEEPLLILDRFVTEQRQRLKDLYDLLDPSLRARVAAFVDELERVAGTARAVLSSAPVVRSAGRAAGDGWAVSRITDHTTALAAGEVTDLAGAGLGSAGEGVAAAGGSTGGGDPGGGGDGNLVDDLVGGVTGGSPSGGGSPLPSLPVPLPTSTDGPLPGTVTSPLPDITSPLPDVSLPVPEPSAPVPSLPVPLPSVSACVPVPPLTTC